MEIGSKKLFLEVTLRINRTCLIFYTHDKKRKTFFCCHSLIILYICNFNRITFYGCNSL